jgi:hypothetical protein
MLFACVSVSTQVVAQAAAAGGTGSNVSSMSQLQLEGGCMASMMPLCVMLQTHRNYMCGWGVPTSMDWLQALGCLLPAVQMRLSSWQLTVFESA